MLIRSLIKDTLSLQGFRVYLIVRYSFGISVKIVADKRYQLHIAASHSTASNTFVCAPSFERYYTWPDSRL